MKKRIVTLIVFLLTTCMMLSGCSSDGSKPTVQPGDVVSEEPTNGDGANTENHGGLYTYTVGNVSLQLEHRIEDYITEHKVFRYRDFAKDCGSWYIKNPAFAEDDDYFTYVFDDEKGGGFVLFRTDDDVMGDIEYGGVYTESFYGKVKFSFDLAEKEYTFNRLFGYKADFNQIVIVCYILENYKNDSGIDIFKGVFEEEGAYYVISQ